MIFNIIKKELLQNFRDKKAMFWMILFPIIMIFILGNSLSSFFSKDNLSVPKTIVVYSLEKNTEETKKLLNFFNHSKKELNMEFFKGNNKDKIIQDIKQGKYDCYIEIKDIDNITIYSNNIKDFNASLVKNLLDIYAEKTNVIDSIVKANPLGFKYINLNEKPDFVKIRSLDKLQTPTAFDYYSVTMLTMIVLYSVVTGSMTIIGEKARNTIGRIACSSVSKFKLFLGKLIAAYAVVTFQIGVLFLFTKYVFKANWGNNLPLIFLVILSLIFMALSLGMGIARIFRNINLVSVFSNIIIVFLNFLGGAYIPLESFGQNNLLITISFISPLRWTNDAIFKMIYGNNNSLVLTAVVVNIISGLIFICIPSVFEKRGGV